MVKDNIIENLSILCVDDNTNMLIIIKTMLNGLGCKSIHTATDAAEAFEIFWRQPIDLIITDYVLPTLDGVELTQIIRTANDSPNIKVPIIMLSAYAERYRIENARDNGVNEFLRKPVSTKDLYLRIVEHFRKPREFINATNYVGPDRRRKINENYLGKEKRSTDSKLDNVNLDSV